MIFSNNELINFVDFIEEMPNNFRKVKVVYDFFDNYDELNIVKNFNFSTRTLKTNV